MMNIPDEVIEQAARISWADEPGATIAEFDQLNPVGRAELMDTARKSAEVVAAWARKEALKEAANVAAVVARARGTALQVVDAVYDLRNPI